MIYYQNGIFHLQSDHFSYLFRITKQGLPEHIHFGVPVSIEDVKALACKSGIGWGSSVLYSQKDHVCLDYLPLEWSGSGRGDYRESPVLLEYGATAAAADFTYRNHEIVQGIVPIKCGLPTAQDGVMTRRAVLKKTAARSGGGLCHACFFF